MHLPVALRLHRPNQSRGRPMSVLPSPLPGFRLHRFHRPGGPLWRVSPDRRDMLGRRRRAPTIRSEVAEPVPALRDALTSRLRSRGLFAAERPPKAVAGRGHVGVWRPKPQALRQRAKHSPNAAQRQRSRGRVFIAAGDHGPTSGQLGSAATWRGRARQCQTMPALLERRRHRQSTPLRRSIPQDACAPKQLLRGRRR
jgi:hypothetical protein